MNKMMVYNRLPLVFQNIACSIEGKRIVLTRYNKQFWEILKHYEERKTWSKDKLLSFRDYRLRKIIEYSYTNIAYYKRWFKECGVDPLSVKRLDDLSRLPVLTKAIVNNNMVDFISPVFPKHKMLTMHTSGTTGTGFVFKTSQKANIEQWAVWWRYRRNIGIGFNNWCAMFGGRTVVPTIKNKPPYYRVNISGRQIYFSAYHMSEDNMPNYIKALEKYKPEWIHGYPSSISILAQFMLDNHIHLSYDIRFITTGAENLLEWQKNVIEAAFGIMPYQHYGMSEGVANISEDINHNWVIDEDYACVEFVEECGNYKIIGTSLTNYAMPLIRYEIGDIAEYDVENRRVLSIDGRKEDYIKLPNGSKIGRLDHIFKDMTNVKEAHIRQDEKGNITFCVVKGRKYQAADEERLNKEIKERLGSAIYSIKYLDSIERSNAGKLRFVVSEYKK